MILTSAKAEPAVAVAPFPPTPLWEQRFWDAAQHPDWQQGEFLEDVVAAVPDEQIQGVLDQLVREYGNASDMLIEMLAERWSTKDPAAAAHWISCLPDNEMGHRVHTKVARQWAQGDLAAATNWLGQLPPGGNQLAVELAVADESAAQNQPVAALTLLARVPPGPERDEVLEYAVQQWAVTDTSSALAWINQYPDSPWRQKITGQILLNLGARNPSTAAAMIASLTNQVVPSDAVVHIARFWASVDPGAATEWVMGFPPGSLQDEAVANLAEASAH
ncbi:MAG TPA: hypothetical protein VF988_00515 [Verrucomicrobiae bacterium]